MLSASKVRSIGERDRVHRPSWLGTQRVVAGECRAGLGRDENEPGSRSDVMRCRTVPLVPNNQPLMGIVTVGDITERKRPDETLRASEGRYRSLFESNPNPRWVFDVETLSFLAVNAAA